MSGAALPAYAVSARSVYRFYRAGDDETLALRGVSLTWPRASWWRWSGPPGRASRPCWAAWRVWTTRTAAPSGSAGERMSHRPEAVRARMRAEHIGVVAASGNLFDHLTRRGQRRARAAPDAARGPGGRSTRCSARSGWRPGPGPTRASSPAASPRARGSRSRWRSTRPWCSPTSRPASWTRTTEGEILDLLRATARRRRGGRRGQPQPGPGRGRRPRGRPARRVGAAVSRPSAELTPAAAPDPGSRSSWCAARASAGRSGAGGRGARGPGGRLRRARRACGSR